MSTTKNESVGRVNRNEQDEAGPIFTKVPVTALGEDQIIGLSVFLPKNRQPKKAVFCFPGGTYDKQYYDIVAQGRQDYSLARWLANDGNIVICIDHVGVGDSSRPADGAALTREVLADAGALAVDYVTAKLTAGKLIAEWSAMAGIPRVGVGHSLGGLVLLTLQARHRTFDAIAVLGWSNQPSSVTNKIPAPEPYVAIDRKALRPFFHLNDVPEDLIVADDLRAEPVPAGILLEGQEDQISAADARTVDVPVFLCFGELDLCPDTHLEPSTYPNADDVTLFRLMKSAHNHNFASSRIRFFRRLSCWIAGA